MSKETADLPQKEGVIQSEDAEPPSGCKNVLYLRIHSWVSRLGHFALSHGLSPSQEEIDAFRFNHYRKRSCILRLG